MASCVLSDLQLLCAGRLHKLTTSEVCDNQMVGNHHLKYHIKGAHARVLGPVAELVEKLIFLHIFNKLLFQLVSRQIVMTLPAQNIASSCSSTRTTLSRWLSDISWLPFPAIKTCTKLSVPQSSYVKLTGQNCQVLSTQFYKSQLNLILRSVGG